jgi:hypothetical protein
MVLMAALAGACSKSPGASDAGARGEAGADAPISPAFAAQALTYAGQYLAWGRVDDELRWAPGLCRLPRPGLARPSESDDATTHGRKLYSVFAKNSSAYPNGPHADQVVVKQAWTAELVNVPFDPDSTRAADGGDHFYPYAQSDGGVYRAASPAGLYLMFKVARATPDTDEGWVYATITAAGQVTAAGRVASCMKCHAVAEHERLFGVPVSPHL